MLLVVRVLDRAAPVRLIDGEAHRVRDLVRVHDHVAIDVPRGAADRLDQRAAGPQVALLVGIEDADEAHLRQVETLAQQVDADDDVVDTEAQVAQDLDALKRVHLAVEVVGADAHLLQVVGEVFGHPLRERRDEHALAAVDACPRFIEQVIDLASGRPNVDHRVE